MSAPETSSQVDHDARFRQEAQDAFAVDISNISSEQDMLDELTSIRSFSFHFIKDALRSPAAVSEVAQQGLNQLWHMFLETAKVFDSESAYQEKLVALLLWTKEFDSLYRSLHPTKTAAGSWEGYRFASSLQASWEPLLTTGTASQQRNLAAFSAKALAVGVCRDSIGLTALWYLREALETDDEAKVIHLLPATVVWIEQCSDHLLAFSAMDHSSEESSKAQLLAPGALGQKAGIDQHGYSMKRWLLWRRRLQELSHNADPAVAKTAKKGFMRMINCGNNLDYNVPGEAKFNEKLQAVMGEALVKSGKDSVDGDDVDINVDWVD
ncbi:hypothetical protein MMC32_008260 [Xylographa parallela]|nr:hypothetical protein [Xylographa parallela]